MTAACEYRQQFKKVKRREKLSHVSVRCSYFYRKGEDLRSHGQFEKFPLQKRRLMWRFPRTRSSIVFCYQLSINLNNMFSSCELSLLRIGRWLRLRLKPTHENAILQLKLISEERRRDIKKMCPFAVATTCCHEARQSRNNNNTSWYRNIWLGWKISPVRIRRSVSLQCDEKQLWNLFEYNETIFWFLYGSRNIRKCSYVWANVKCICLLLLRFQRRINVKRQQRKEKRFIFHTCWLFTVRTN